MPKTPTSEIGDLVLFRLDADVVRPFLIHAITPEGVASGTLFTMGPEDNGTFWVVKNCFFRPTTEAAMVYVKEATQGPAVGHWMPKERR